MPIHDWTKVKAGIFDDFHHGWIWEQKRALNRGLLPSGYYALAEQIAGDRGPDVLTLEGPTNGPLANAGNGNSHRLAVATAPPKVRFHAKAEVDRYAAKAKAVVIRHSSDHRVVAVIEIVSPGNKTSRQALRKFVDKAAELLRGGIHLLIIDLFPPSPRDPEGIHKAIWDEFIDSDFELPDDLPLTQAAYIGGPIPEAFVEPTAVGKELIEMPLFLETDEYVPVPLESTYRSAWDEVPDYWREVLDNSK